MVFLEELTKAKEKNMNYRAINYKQDISEVVSLIQRNLQPRYSEEILVWKHLKNPFGSSLSMVAIEKDKIIGVVFYMRYNFRNSDGNIIRCIRPFDGCTEKEHRGKGIFKSLMSATLDKYHLDYDFLLANPNGNSYPEFLKLGWFEKEQEYYRIGLVNPLYTSPKEEINQTSLLSENEPFDQSENFYQAGNTLEFIKWRYQQDNYKALKIKDKNKVSYLIYRVESKAKIKAIVLCDYFGDFSKINNAIRKVCKLEGTYFIYYLKNTITEKIKFLGTKKHKKAIKVFKTNQFDLPPNLVISLGDMEGRL